MQPAPDFWEPQTIEEIAHAQQTHPVASTEGLTFGFWPADESADDFIEYIYGRRRDDFFREI